MSLFSSAHQHEMVNQFWHSGSARCPHDGTELDSHFHVQETGYFLVLACVQCGKKSQVTRFSDPHRPNFRRWNSSEIDTLTSHASTSPPQCPVCSARVKISQKSGRSFQLVECLRCGNFHYFTPIAQRDELLGSSL